jgi:hypothetical protein
MASRIHFFTLVLAALLAAPPPALAGDVYKCTVNGATVYQGMPCANGRKIEVRTSAPPPPVAKVVFSDADPAKLSLAELQDEIRLVTGLQRGLVSQREVDVKATNTRLGAAASDLAREREDARIRASWDPQLAEAGQRLARLMAELRKRCPGGTSVRDGVQVCSE